MGARITRQINGFATQPTVAGHCSRSFRQSVRVGRVCAAAAEFQKNMNETGAKEKPLVLVVDDDPPICRLLRHALEPYYRVVVASNCREGLVQAAQQQPALVLLDLGLPDFNGMTLLRQLREWSAVPVIVLSVQDGENEKVAALDGGADDYVTKPFNTMELLARARCAMRKGQNKTEDPTFRSGDLVVDLVTRRVTLGGQHVALTVTEFSLLQLLIRHKGKVLTHRQILREIWGPNAEEQISYLRVYMAHLRKKMEKDPANPQLLVTEAGVGYRLTEPL
jgi:two-component system KDP operon response regulator KdpE